MVPAKPDSPPHEPRQTSVSWVVFQDDRAPRSFRIPLASIERVGWLLGALIAALILSTALTLRYFNLSRAPAPTGQAAEYAARWEAAKEKAQALEKELGQVKSELAQTRAQAPSPLPVALPSTTTESATGSQPPPDVTTAAPTPVLASLFTALPPQYGSTPLPRESLPIELTAPTWTFKDKTLNVKFAIQYTRGDNGTQQGKILLLARSGSRIYAYPEGVLQGAESKFLLEPGRGEYFSVQRYREVIADFGPVPSREEIKEVQIILLSVDGKILVSDRITPQFTAKTKAQTPKPN